MTSRTERRRAPWWPAVLALSSAFASLATARIAGGQPARDDPRYGIDLRAAVVVTPVDLSPPERTAVRMLVEEIQKRSLLRLPVSPTWPSETTPVIAIGPTRSVRAWAGVVGSRADDLPVPGREGYRLMRSARSR